MAWRTAKSLDVLLAQVNALAPHRDKSSDGTIGNAAHQATKSDHNPNAAGVVCARDITHDPANGCDSYKLAEQLRTAKDARVQYVISNRKIANADIDDWAWRPYNGASPHDQHVHVSVRQNPRLYDDDSTWTIDSIAPDSGSTPTAPMRPAVLRKGAKGAYVELLQRQLKITADGDFGAETERAVMAFQRAHGLVPDGVVGTYTWREIGAPTAPAATPAPTPPPVFVNTDLVHAVAELAGASALAHVDWKNRGRAPIGYIKGMAVVFALALKRLRLGDPAAVEMAKAIGAGSNDALVWYGSKPQPAGANVLRALFVLMIGLGMRESSGRYCEGRDRSASNVKADTAEAGLFQMSWDAHTASPFIGRVMDEYGRGREGLLDVFREGVTRHAGDLDSYGSGIGCEFQKLCKTAPAFAVEAAAVGLRNLRTHWGPINRHEAEVRAEADALLLKIQREFAV